MSKKFISTKEHSFIHRINKELIQKVIGQEVIYYSISLEETNVHDLYNEAIKKTWYTPVVLNALVNYSQDDTVSNNFGLEAGHNLEVFCHTQELLERNLKPREGDFVQFNQIYFEIASVTLPQMVFGQPNNKLMTKLTCVAAREGQFQEGSSIKDIVDNSRKDEPRPPRSLGGT